MASFMNVPALSFTPLQTALAASITRGTFVDTKYYLYSQRAPGGKGRTPRAVYANSTIVMTFSDIFTHDLVSSPPDKAGMKEVGDWDFEDDSDLDEEEIFEDIDDSMSDVSSAQSVPSCTTAQFSQDEDAWEMPEGSGYAESGVFNQLPTNNEQSINTTYECFIPNIAATTWKALIFFVYTGRVHFAPLKSHTEAYRRAKEHNCNCPNGPPFCSPKSMFKLARLMGLNELQSRAQASIKANLSDSCIVDEVFSVFSSLHPEILEMQLQYLYSAGTLARVMPKVRQYVKAAVRGSMPHCEVILDILLTKLSETLDSTVKTSAQPARPTTEPTEEALPTRVVLDVMSSSQGAASSAALPNNPVDTPYVSSILLTGPSLPTTSSQLVAPVPPATSNQPPSGNALQPPTLTTDDQTTDCLHESPEDRRTTPLVLETISRDVADGANQADTERFTQSPPNIVRIPSEQFAAITAKQCSHSKTLGDCDDRACKKKKKQLIKKKIQALKC